ncbi:DUF6612 family protein [Macrococcus capreoli]|uniref:DUF6612 family protein n=1 Tax=Macrococcus capreoli TaxID=2982690 RepID=UPI003EE50C51
MKSKHLLSALLGTTLIFAACGNDAANKTEEKAKTETQTKENQKSADTKSTESKESTSKDTTTKDSTSEVKASADLISKAKDAGKDIKSYHAVLNTAMKVDGQDKNVKMDMNVDDQNTTEIKTDSMGQKMNMYIFDKKVVMTPDDKMYMDVTKVMGSQVQKQLEQLDYATALNSLEGYKDAEFKETKDGYQLTKKFKNLAEYKKIAEQTGSQQLLSSVEKELKEVNGEAVITFDKDYMMKATETKVNMTIKDKKIETETKANYDNYGKVKTITIPAEAKNAKPLDQVRKEMQAKQNSSSSEATTEAK